MNRADKRQEKFVAALTLIAALWPKGAKAPEEENYDDTESAYNNGHDVASYEAARIAKRALRGVK